MAATVARHAIRGLASVAAAAASFAAASSCSGDRADASDDLRPPPDKHRHSFYRTVVVGGGIVGASTAYHIALAQHAQIAHGERGEVAAAATNCAAAAADDDDHPIAGDHGGFVSVALLERNASVGAEASGLSAGTIWCAGHPSAGVPADEYATARLCADTMEILRAVEAQGHDCSLRVCGALTVAASRAEAELLRESCAAMRAAGLHAHFVEGAEALMRLEPRLGPRVLAAVHTPLSGHCEL